MSKRKRIPITREILPNKKTHTNVVPPPGGNITFGTTPENTTASTDVVRITTTKEHAPGTLIASTTSATITLAPQRPPTVLVTTELSPSLTPQLKPIVGLKTIVSLTPGPQGLVLLTVPVIATLATKFKQT